MKTAIILTLIAGSFTIGLIISVLTSDNTRDVTRDLYARQEIPTSGYKSY